MKKLFFVVVIAFSMLVIGCNGDSHDANNNNNNTAAPADTTTHAQ